MKMELHKPQGAELQFVRSAWRELPQYLAFDSSSARRRSPLKYLLWPIAALALAGLFMAGGAVMLLAVLVATIGLLGIATAVCVFAQNNSRY
jgi:hypothetical protein